MEALLRTLHDNYGLRLVFLVDGDHYVSDPQTEAERTRAMLDAVREGIKQGRSGKRTGSRLHIFNYLSSNAPADNRKKTECVLPGLALTEALTAIMRVSATYGTEIIQLTDEVDNEIEAYVQEYKPAFLLTSDTDMVILPRTGNVVFVDDVPFETLLQGTSGGQAATIELPVYTNAQLRAYYDNCTPRQLATAAALTGNDVTKGRLSTGDFDTIIDAVVKDADVTASVDSLVTASVEQYLAFSSRADQGAESPPLLQEDPLFPRGLSSLRHYDELFVSPVLLSDGVFGYTVDIPLHRRLVEMQAALLGKRTFKLTKMPLDSALSDAISTTITVPQHLHEFSRIKEHPQKHRYSRVKSFFAGEDDITVSADEKRGVDGITWLFNVCFLRVLAASLKTVDELHAVARAMCICEAVNKSKEFRTAFNQVVRLEKSTHPSSRLNLVAASITSAFERVCSIFFLAGLWDAQKEARPGLSDNRLAPSEVFSGTSLFVAFTAPLYEALLGRSPLSDLDERAAKLMAQVQRFGACESFLSKALIKTICVTYERQCAVLPHAREPFVTITATDKVSQALKRVVEDALNRACILGCLPEMCTVAAALGDPLLFSYLFPKERDTTDKMECRRKLAGPYSNDLLFFLEAYRFLKARRTSWREDGFHAGHAGRFIASAEGIWRQFNSDGGVPLAVMVRDPVDEKRMYYLQIILASISTVTVLSSGAKDRRCFLTNSSEDVASRMPSLPKAQFGNSSTLKGGDGRRGPCISFGFHTRRDVPQNIIYSNVAFTTTLSTHCDSSNAIMAVAALLVANPPRQSATSASPQLQLTLALGNGTAEVRRCIFKQHEDHIDGIDLLFFVRRTARSVEWLVTLLLHVNAILRLMTHRDGQYSAVSPVSKKNLLLLLEQTREGVFASTYQQQPSHTASSSCPHVLSITGASPNRGLWDMTLLVTDRRWALSADTMQLVAGMNSVNGTPST